MFSKVLRTVGCNHHLISNGIDIEGFLSLEIYFMQNGRERKTRFFFFFFDKYGWKGVIFLLKWQDFLRRKKQWLMLRLGMKTTE